MASPEEIAALVALGLSEAEAVALLAIQGEGPKPHQIAKSEIFKLIDGRYASNQARALKTFINQRLSGLIPDDQLDFLNSIYQSGEGGLEKIAAEAFADVERHEKKERKELFERFYQERFVTGLEAQGRLTASPTRRAELDETAKFFRERQGDLYSQWEEFRSAMVEVGGALGDTFAEDPYLALHEFFARIASQVEPEAAGSGLGSGEAVSILRAAGATTAMRLNAEGAREVEFKTALKSWTDRLLKLEGDVTLSDATRQKIADIGVSLSRLASSEREQFVLLGQGIRAVDFVNSLVDAEFTMRLTPEEGLVAGDPNSTEAAIKGVAKKVQAEQATAQDIDAYVALNTPTGVTPAPGGPSPAGPVVGGVSPGADASVPLTPEERKEVERIKKEFPNLSIENIIEKVVGPRLAREATGRSIDEYMRVNEGGAGQGVPLLTSVERAELERLAEQNPGTPLGDLISKVSGGRLGRERGERVLAEYKRRGYKFTPEFEDQYRQALFNKADMDPEQFIQEFIKTQRAGEQDIRARADAERFATGPTALAQAQETLKLMGAPEGTLEQIVRSIPGFDQMAPVKQQEAIFFAIQGGAVPQLTPEQRRDYTAAQGKIYQEGLERQSRGLLDIEDILESLYGESPRGGAIDPEARRQLQAQLEEESTRIQAQESQLANPAGQQIADAGTRNEFNFPGSSNQQRLQAIDRQLAQVRRNVRRPQDILGEDYDPGYLQQNRAEIERFLRSGGRVDELRRRVPRRPAPKGPTGPALRILGRR